MSDVRESVTRQQAAATAAMNHRAAMKTFRMIRDCASAGMEDLGHLRPADGAVTAIAIRLAELQSQMADAKAYGKIAAWLRVPAA